MVIVIMVLVMRLRGNDGDGNDGNGNDDNGNDYDANDGNGNDGNKVLQNTASTGLLSSIKSSSISSVT